MDTMHNRRDTNILIIEIIPKYARLIKFAIDDLGYSSTIISSLSNIVDEIRYHNPDLIIISPKINTDAHTLCFQITSKLNCPALLGIYNSTNDDPKKALNAGATDYFRLPANWDLFKTKVSRCLNERQNKLHIEELISNNFIDCIKVFSKLNTSNIFCVLILKISNNNDSQSYLNHTNTIIEQLSYENKIDIVHVHGNRILLISTTTINKEDIVTLIQSIKSRLDFFIDLCISSAVFLYNIETRDSISTLVHESFTALSSKESADQDIYYLTNFTSIRNNTWTA